ALETYLVRNRLVDGPLLLFYINDPCVIVGRNQNTTQEIDREYVERRSVQVVRRLSGGGAVYQDRGNLCYCFIKDDDGSFRDFGSFTGPVVEALRRMGAGEAALRGRNDLVIGDQKISGNAMYVAGGRMTAHGTLLYDVNLDHVAAALRPPKEKIESKGIKSVRARVTNIRPHLAPAFQGLSTGEFRDEILRQLAEQLAQQGGEQVTEYHLTERDWQEIEKIRQEYFLNWDWNFGRSPDFSLERRCKFPSGLIDVRLNVEKKHIAAIRIYGDFFALDDVSELERALTGVPYRPEDIAAALEPFDLSRYFGAVERDEFVRLVL
ncbi:MAG: lipoate--protein ligase, partial [Deinococcus sp.]|nr:lipoate--protein ligase [Deinococcus sp.]